MLDGFVRRNELEGWVGVIKVEHYAKPILPLYLLYSRSYTYSTYTTPSTQQTVDKLFIIMDFHCAFHALMNGKELCAFVCIKF